jgi:hypothetical protein
LDVVTIVSLQIHILPSANGTDDESVDCAKWSTLRWSMKATLTLDQMIHFEALSFGGLERLPPVQETLLLVECKGGFNLDSHAIVRNSISVLS